MHLESILRLLNPLYLFNISVEILYRVVQVFIILLFKPPPPDVPEQPKEPYGRIAVIGAGLTGISSAAHCIAHNFDVTIYEAGPKVGGIWAKVNKTSGLQLNSMLYRFHPGVYWKHTFPHRDEILGEIQRIWKEYQLESRTKFNTSVKKVTRAPQSSTKPAQYGHARWMINGTEGPYDAIIVNVGTCGEPMMIDFEGQDQFTGQVIHSSQLDDTDLEGKKVVVIGSGASGVEAAELAVNKNAKGTVVMLARDDKWIIPRNIIFDTMISAQPFGRQMPLSFIPEWFLKTFHYRDLKDLAPYRTGIFEGTPIVNDDFLKFVRQGRAAYVRGDTKGFTRDGVKVNRRGWGSKPGDEGEEVTYEADVVVLATGYKRPSIDFLPKDLFPERYQRPSLYLQNFSTEDWSILMTNSSYQNAIGTVGHFHIGIYTRILLAFLLDKGARPLPEDMQLWVDGLRFLKRGAKGGALGFFTYMELTIWLLSWHLWRPNRLKWLLFIMQGWGIYTHEGNKKRRHA